jgi:hypothetical protein
MVVPACTTPVTTDESEGGFPHWRVVRPKELNNFRPPEALFILQTDNKRDKNPS